MGLDDRSYYCPACGGWLEGSEEFDTWSCDTCDYVCGEGSDDSLFGNQITEENNDTAKHNDN